MKTLNLEKIEKIEAGGAGAACFGTGLLAVASLGLLSGGYLIYILAPSISYCWNT